MPSLRLTAYSSFMPACCDIILLWATFPSTPVQSFRLCTASESVKQPITHKQDKSLLSKSHHSICLSVQVKLLLEDNHNSMLIGSSTYPRKACSH